ncbi:helix-turn-helix transcriptional regulator [Hymenobacter sp. 15J16-1T3B]|uniref:winged helix-turn-helix transcriptional regulator n=1 Tax=Hymenobacter sp. 15J16-1T3B TaxID=2886941 RepID=UPI001D10FE24|nr:helix-turn-helix domain-containing protein [Hymenobacter sp. 15J16-1T3B]MCC3160658.1 helix-turn-helix transcriptional regulator [Hymenobacter sp. 15J16-1T3B]
MSTLNPQELRPIWDALAVVCGRWRMPIIHCLCGQPLRFSELEAHLDCITPKALAEHLHALELNGLVHREVVPSRPIVTRYGLTEHGRTVLPLLQEMRRFGEQHRQHLTTEV